MRRKYRTADAMALADDDARHAVLTDARFLRKRKTAALLGRTARLVVDEYDGDLRKLCERAHGTGDRVAALVRKMPGIGAVGADTFCREVQAVWPTLQPWSDQRMAEAARELGLPHTARGLGDALGTRDLSLVGAALVRCSLAGDAGAVRGGS